MGAAQGKFSDSSSGVVWQGSDAVVLDSWTLEIPQEDQLPTTEVRTDNNEWRKRFDPLDRAETQPATEAGPELRHHILRVTFTVRDPQISHLQCLFTPHTAPFERVPLGEPYPFNEHTPLSGGIKDVEPVGGELKLNELLQCEFHLYLPKHLSQRQLFACLMDQQDVVLFKARALFLTESELDISRKHQQAEQVARMERERNLAQLKLNNGESGFRALIAAASDNSPQATMFLVAKDGTKLAYRLFMPQKEPTCILILPSHLYIMFHTFCGHLTAAYPIMVVMIDLRGYGQSGGKRATSSDRKDLWRDLRTAVRHFKYNYPMLPIFLGGYFRGGGTVLNYATWNSRERVDGYVFLAPDQGKSDAFNVDGFKAFHKDVQYKVNWGSIVLGALTGGLINGQQPAYEFQYPDALARNAPVDNIGINDLLASRPIDARKQFASIEVPFGFWVGSEDEFFFPKKAVVAPSASTVPGCEVKIIQGATHLTLLEAVVDPLGSWVTATAANTKKTVPPEAARRRLEAPVINSAFEFADVVMDEVRGLQLDERQQLHISAPDGARLSFFLYEPGAPAVATLVFMEGPLAALLANKLSSYFPIRVVSYLGREDPQGTATRATLLSDVRTIIQHVRYNFPSVPVMLGGHGIGASLALNYGLWKEREPVQALVIVSPTADALRSDPLLRKKSQGSGPVDVVGSTSQTWLPQMLTRSDSFSIHYYPEGKAGAPVAQHFSRSAWEAYFVPSLKDALSSLDFVFGLWVGDSDELTDHAALIAHVQKNSSVQLKELELMRGGTHFGSLLTAPFRIGPWIERMAKLLNPATELRLENPEIDDFEKRDLIGKGAFGNVYLVLHKRTNRFLALKQMRKTKLMSYGEREARGAVRERNVLRELSSPFLVHFYGSFQDEASLYIIMEYVIGGELYTHLKVEGRFSEERTRFYAAELVLFFEYIHSKQLVYRDLKPENILIDSLGHIKVTDFGFSRFLEKGKKSRTFCGTPEYIAPEMIIGDEYDYSVDFWSLGMLVYEMLNGSTPFATSPSARDLYRKVLYSDIPYPSKMDPVARDFVKKLLVREPALRLGSSGGVTDLMRHRWFKGLSFDALRRREMEAPFIPRVASEADTSYFLPANTASKGTPGYTEEPAEVPSGPEAERYLPIFAEF